MTSGTDSNDTNTESCHTVELVTLLYRTGWLGRGVVQTVLQTVYVMTLVILTFTVHTYPLGSHNAAQYLHLNYVSLLNYRTYCRHSNSL